MAEHWKLKPETLGSTPSITTFLLNPFRFKGLQTATAQFVSLIKHNRYRSADHRGVLSLLSSAQVTTRKELCIRSPARIVIYISETKMTLKVRLGEQKQADRRGIPKKALLSTPMSLTIDWDDAKVRRSVLGYWQRRVTEAIQIKGSRQTMYLDGGLQLSTMRNPILNPP